MDVDVSQSSAAGTEFFVSPDFPDSLQDASADEAASSTGLTTPRASGYRDMCPRAVGSRQRSYTDDVGLSDDDTSGRHVNAGLPEFQASSPRASVDLPPQSPIHGVWLHEPPSIDEPLVLLDDEEAQQQAQERVADAILQLRAELAEAKEEARDARATSKADRAALEAKENGTDELQEECNKLHAEQMRLESDNILLRQQLQDHHGVMAADWEQAIRFRERLRQEEATCERLSDEVAELRENIGARTEEAASLRTDAGHWRVLSNPDSMKEATAVELDKLLDVASSAVGPLHIETRTRSRAVTLQLSSELEQQLCVVCRDTKKAVLFLPCQHVCVCEGCRSRLRPYRCPLCQEPVQSHIERVHF